MSAAVQPARHLDALTGIRGVAAWMVVFYHVRPSLTGLFPARAIDLFAHGFLAVDLFFVLSGFVLWFTYADRLRERSASTGEFLWRRFARIWPLHAVILGAFVAFALVLTVTGRDTSGYPWAELPLHLLLVQNWGFTQALSWNHPAWSISTEWAAYLCFPLSVMLLRWDRLPAWLLPVAAAALIGLLHLVFGVAGETSLGEDIVHLGLARCLIEFTLGNVACVMWRRWHGLPAIAPVCAAGCLAALFGWLMLGVPQTLAVPAVFLLLILALAFDTGPVSRLLSGKVLLYLGEISYSTYLVHFLLFILFKIAVVDDSAQLGPAGLAGFLAVLFVVSAGLYHGVEKPAQRWLNGHRPGARRKQVALAAE